MAAPATAQRMTHYPLGVTSFGFPLVGKTTGRVFFVDSTNNQKGDDLNHGETPQQPFATIAYAVSQTNLAANRGDIVYVLPGHIETITSLGAISMSVAGVKLVGIGDGRDRPKVTLSSDTAASIVIAAANCRIENIIIDMTGIDAIGTGGSGAGGVRIQADDFALVGNELIIATGANQVTCAIGVTTGANRCRILSNLIAGTATAGPVMAIHVFGAGALTLEGLEIVDNRIVGDFSTAAILISMTDTLLNAYIFNNKIFATGTDQSCLRVTAATGSLGIVEENKMIGSDLTALYDSFGAGIANINNWGYDSNTSGLLAVPIPVSGTQLPSDSSLVDQIIGQEFSSEQANYFAVVVDFSSGSWNTVAKHEVVTVTGSVRLIIIPECTSNLTSGGAATLQLGDELLTTAYLAATLFSDITTGKFWLNTTPARDFAKSAVFDRIIQGVDVGYEVLVAALTGGIIRFHCWWIPLSATSTAVAGTGVAL